MKKKTTVICIILAVLLIVALLVGILVPKRIRVGVMTGTPMAYKNADGEWTGFDIEFANKMFSEMGRIPEYIEVTATTREYMLKKGEIDCYMSATGALTDEFIMSDAYISSVQVVLHKRIEDVEINTPDDLKQYRVGILSGSKNQQLLEKYMARRNILKHPTNDEMVKMLDIEDIGVAIVDSSFAQKYANDENYKIGITFDTLDKVIVFGQKSNRMCKKTNKIIQKYRQEGFFDALKEQYKMREHYK